MRVICENCHAQYEVPDAWIPETGRNVQCAQCHDTWVQTPSSRRETPPTRKPAHATPPVPPHRDARAKEPRTPEPRTAAEATSRDGLAIIREEVLYETRLRAQDAERRRHQQSDRQDRQEAGPVDTDTDRHTPPVNDAMSDVTPPYDNDENDNHDTDRADHAPHQDLAFQKPAKHGLFGKPPRVAASSTATPDQRVAPRTNRRKRVPKFIVGLVALVCVALAASLANHEPTSAIIVEIAHALANAFQTGGSVILGLTMQAAQWVGEQVGNVSL